mgnify:CR=1 FL=1
MRKLFWVLLVVCSLIFIAPAWSQDAQVTKVDPEKFQKLTPEQKEKFTEGMRSAQRAAEASAEEYNEVEKEATEAKETAETIRDTSVDILERSVGGK